MKADGVRPDLQTYSTLIDICAKVSDSVLIKQNYLHEITELTLPQATEHGVADLSDADKVLETMKEEGILDLDKGEGTLLSYKSCLEVVKVNSIPYRAVICNSYLNCAKADGSSAALVAAEKILDIMPMEQVTKFPSCACP